MNKVVLIVAVIVLLILGGAIAWFFINPSAPNTSTTNPTVNPNSAVNPTPIPNGKGALYFTVTDAAAAMGSVTAVSMTIDSVDVYSKTQGWVNVSSVAQSYSLLDLKAKFQALLLAKAFVNPDTYTQFKLRIAKVMVTAAGVQKEAKLPSNNFAFEGNVIVSANTSSAGRFDVIADSSMHKTTAGEFVFAPVIKFDSSTNTTVKVAADNSVVVFGGLINPSVNAGMDATGAVKLNYILDPKTNLRISATGVISASGLLK